MKYIQSYRKYYLLLIIVLFACQLYFLFLLPEVEHTYLWYLDLLLVVVLSVFGSVDAWYFYQKEKHLKECLSQDVLIAPELNDYDNVEIAVHDVDILQQQLHEQITINHDLQDYIMTWCHEVKLPLSAAKLMNEQMQDKDLQMRQREQLEKMNLLLNTVLAGCRIQSHIIDLQIRKCSLLECVKTSIRNNQYFLIHEHFELEMDVMDHSVYSDPQWLVYVLDQLIANAIKYRREKPFLKLWSEHHEHAVCLYIEDHGEGIETCDLRRIFEKGFTGKNHHNGRYHSTGMGLYMSSIILEKLGHDMQVESHVGSCTRFTLTFTDQRDYFHLNVT